jgi:tRNA nucleotidyltransferase (CCA-adding enzyme)
MLSKKHLEICRDIKDAGGQPFVVGGFVRDLIAGRPCDDIDLVAVGMTRSGLMEALPRGTWVGRDFPVLLVDGVEIAMARLERKDGEGHAGFACDVKGVSLEDDLGRRDLTMNAMAMNPFTHQIIDPFGGREDIADNILMPVSSHFREDPLRVVRAARFAAQFHMAVGGALLSEALEVRDELHTLTAERISKEMFKALASDRPSTFFRVLNDMEALEIIFPEIHALINRPQPEKYHPEGDAYTHTMLVIDRARELGADEVSMYAALVHDLGKAVTPDDNLPHHYDHEGLGVPLVASMSDRLRVPRRHKVAGMAASKYHLNVHRFEALREVTKVRLIVSLLRKGVLEEVALASQADAQGRGPTKINEPYPQRDRLREAAKVVQGVKGGQFAHLKDGRVIAQKMEQARVRALKEAGFGKVKSEWGKESYK